MSIIKFTCATLSGALNPSNGPVEKIRVGKNKDAEVCMEGHIGAGRIKRGDDYVASAYGRLPVKAAVTGEGDKKRYILDIAGGLRGVLFKNKDKGSDAKAPDYVGNIEADDLVYPLFGRLVNSENGQFISLSSGEAEPKRNRGGSSHDDAEHGIDDGGNVPF